MGNHLCTTQSLRAGVDMPPSECPFCKHKALFMDWCGATCDTCGASFYDHSGFTLRDIRLKLGMTRRELADTAGLKPSTIKRYEWCGPSKRYWEWMKWYTKFRYGGAEGG